MPPASAGFGPKKYMGHMLVPNINSITPAYYSVNKVQCKQGPPDIIGVLAGPFWFESALEIPPTAVGGVSKYNLQEAFTGIFDTTDRSRWSFKILPI
jgi:hypothetical protein